MNVYSIDTSASGSGDVKVKLLSKNSRITVEARQPSASGSRAGSPAISTNAEASTSSIATKDVQQPARTTSNTHTHPMFGDEEVNPFFRRLAFSPDGSLLVTPAGITEASPSTEKKGKRAALTTVDASITSADKEKPKTITGKDSALKQKRIEKGTSPTVYLFARGQLENETPVAHLPGHRTSSIVIKFNPVLWNLRDKKSSVKGKEKAIDGDDVHAHAGMEVDNGGVDAESVGRAATNGVQLDVPEEESGKAILGKDGGRTPPQAEESDPPASNGDGIFALRKRSIYAVATHESILIYDTQQSAPICMFGSLHFAAFTDLSW